MPAPRMAISSSNRMTKSANTRLRISNQSTRAPAFRRADETFGVKVDFISLNEADGGFNLKFSATQQASLIKLAGPLFSQLGLSYTPKWLVGDTGNASRLVNYATTILSDPGAAPYLGP